MRVRKVFFAIPSLRLGGAELETIKLANHLSTDNSLNVGIVITSISDKSPLSSLLSKSISVYSFPSPLAKCLPRSLHPLAEAFYLAYLNVYCRPKAIIGILDDSVVRLAIASWLVSCVPRYSLSFLIWQTYERKPLRGNFLRRFLISLSFKKASRIIAVSSIVRQSIIALKLAANDKISLLSNSFDFTQIRQLSLAETNLKKEMPLITYCGRLVEGKGILEVIYALKTVSSEMELGLLIIGEGPLEKSIKSLVSQLGLSARVIFIPPVTNPFPYYRISKAVLLCSESEGFGNVIVEALACGTHVVATDKCGVITDFISSLDNITIISNNYPSSIANALINIPETATDHAAMIYQLSQKLGMSSNAAIFKSILQKTL